MQTFIAAARTVRDLWTGSYILAWLTWQAMQPVREACGQEAFVAPDLSDPADRFFGGDQLHVPCFPNRFIAEVPAGQAAALAQQCVSHCRVSWRGICDHVREGLQQHIQTRAALQRWASTWPHLWDAQLDSFFDLRTVVLPHAACDVGLLGRLLKPEQRCQTGANEAERLWTDRLELLGGLMAASKLIRPLPPYQPRADEQGRFPQKCSLLGTLEQMGPAALEEARTFWEHFAALNLRGTRTRQRERLCAVSLVKRFAWPAFFAQKTSTHPRELRFDDTATVAAGEWLKRHPCLHSYAQEQRGSQWLHWSRPDQREDEEELTVPADIWRALLRARATDRPPTYYAVLMLDGDRMGQKFRAGAGAAQHRKISQATADFARRRVQGIVEACHGSLIYAGGDDVLALVPTHTALGCGQRLAEAFTASMQQYGPPEVGKATVSSGITVVHYKEDLRFALRQAREAEHEAKESGRDAFCLRVCRRSGEHTSVAVPWSLRQHVEALVDLFVHNAPDRWTYQLQAELPTLEATFLPWDAVVAEVDRLVSRAEAPDAGQQTRLRQAVTDCLRAYAKECTTRNDQPGAAHVLAGFVTLCQSASFLARGRDA